LLEAIAGINERTHRLAHEELLSLGAAATAPLAGVLGDVGASDALRMAAAEALGALDSPAAAEVLLQRVELARKQVDDDARLRARCAWRLGSGTQDWIVPRLLLDLRYETDYETVICIASTLAHFGNYAGLDGLFVISRDAQTTQALRDLALSTAARLASDAHVADAATLLRTWIEGDPQSVLPDHELSLAHQLEVWRMVRGFSEWQLRGVDDARFALQRESRRVATLIAPALLDENRYVRTHTAQVLERMGRRARGTGPALLAALDDPQIAPQIALALGAVGHAAAESALIARLAPAHPLELRVACARALGSLALASSARALDLFVDARQPLDLRIAAACARIHCSPDDTPRATLELLLAHLAANDTETAAPELALDAWLAHRAPTSPAAAAVLTSWRSISPSDPRERVAQRAQLLSEQLGVLCGQR
jgi:hypothetical protein